ncbi:MAG: 2-oxoacid:acceptor oxidoreductase subunit alpha [candidate division NC10 bacterium]|nr:2-oxoacid:acceptor oxidoreductase subunit alpha [candidate division NC10 bacterium]MBI4413672.1 2-oxoacid:acceptor oxidoreductase subunit alpha [candidate division NC10 bacterium]
MAQKGKDLVIRVGGESGEGVISTGELITKAAAQASLHVSTFRTFPAEIKGGPAMFQVRVSDLPLLTHGDFLDVLMAFNQEAFDRHTSELKKDGVLVYDSSAFTPPDGDGFVRYAVPLTDLAKKEVGRAQSKNMVALGVLGHLFELPYKALEEAIAKRFQAKGHKIVESNLIALKVGYDYVTREVQKRDPFKLPEAIQHQRMVIAGNQAISLGVMAAGCRFVTGYPITPASDILEELAEELPKFGGTAIQAEDEMAALAACIGASFTGQKAFTCTSGPGFSLMTELFNLASMAELPVVIADIQRAGPSTGMPTKAEQSDLFHALFGGHGEAPRVVLATANVADCFYLTVLAFNIAEKYQIPVILMSDQALSSRAEGIEPIDLSKVKLEERLKPTPEQLRDYKRYAFSETGVSPMAIPGESGLGGVYCARGIEHDEHGVPNYEPAVHREMTRKRFRKLEAMLKDLPPPPVYGPADAKVGVIGWGSTEGAIHEALGMAAEKGIRAAGLHLRVLNPLQDESIKAFLKGKKRIVIPEMNYNGQLAHILRARYLIDPIQLDVCEGRPIKVVEILQAIEEAAHGH